jgi:drug/metabolite transporter (DMT)-like permease
MFIGDLLQLLAEFSGGDNPLHKRFMARRFNPSAVSLSTHFSSGSHAYQPDSRRSGSSASITVLLSLFYQSIIVAFISFFVWFNLIHTYSVSRLSSFTFFGPIFGVVFGTVFLGEEFTFSLMIGLPMVCLGIFLVNWRKAIP